MSEKLSTKKRNENLNKLHGWKKTRGRDSIEKEFIFKDSNSSHKHDNCFLLRK